MDFSQCVEAHPEVLIRDLDGEAILLNLVTEEYFGLDNVGTEMWKWLTKSNSIQEAFTRLEESYNVSPEQLRSDLETFVAQLIENELLVLCES